MMFIYTDFAHMHSHFYLLSVFPSDDANLLKKNHIHLSYFFKFHLGEIFVVLLWISSHEIQLKSTLLPKWSLFSRKQAIPLHLFHVFYKEHDLLENECRGTADEMTCMWVRVWKIRWNRGALHQYWIRNADITPGAVSWILLPVPWKREITKITSTSSKRVYIPVSLWL